MVWLKGSQVHTFVWGSLQNRFTNLNFPPKNKQKIPVANQSQHRVGLSQARQRDPWLRYSCKFCIYIYIYRLRAKTQVALYNLFKINPFTLSNMTELQNKRLQKNLIGRNNDPGATPTWRYQIVPGRQWETNFLTLLAVAIFPLGDRNLSWRVKCVLGSYQLASKLIHSGKISG